MSTAEDQYREAFARLKQGKPTRLPKGTPVSQNNVAKEAGRDPSALKKDRFPALIREIQAWVDKHGEDKPPSARQAALASRKRNRELRDKIKQLKVQRDEALSLLVQADAKILDLALENARLKALVPESKVTRIDKQIRPNKLGEN